MYRYLGLDRSLLWAFRGLLRLFVRATLVPEDARQRLARGRPLLYVFEERSLSDRLAVEQVCTDGHLRRPGQRLRAGGLVLPRSFVALERRAGVLRRRPDRRTPAELAAAGAAPPRHPAPHLARVPVAGDLGRAP